jgi:hypothetical protein
MVFFLIVLLSQAGITAIEGPANSQGAYRSGIRIMWYNTENFFHPSDDSVTTDDDFTPGGLYHWTFGRYREKVTRIAKLIIAAGEGEPPEVVGLGEIECDSVLEDLVGHPILAPYGYRYLHHDSPDHRGIDVACLYRQKRIRLLGWCTYSPVSYNTSHPDSSGEIADRSMASATGPGTEYGRTREILHGWWLLNKTDTLDLLLVHLISRYGGIGATAGYRQQQSRQIFDILDSVGRLRPAGVKVVAGDFNDEFTGLTMQPFREDTVRVLDYRIPAMNGNAGSYKYRGRWELIDFFLVSGPAPGFEISGRIFTLPPLLTADETYGGLKPFRTFEGIRYAGGTSDHLPVLLDLIPGDHY